MNLGSPSFSMLLVSAMALCTIAAVNQAIKVSRRTVVSRRLMGVGFNGLNQMSPSPITGPRSVFDCAARWKHLPDVPAWLLRAMQRAALPIDPQTLWSTWLIAGLLGAALALTLEGPGLAMLVAVIVIAGPMVVLWAMRERSAHLCATGLPLLLESVARSMRSGASLRQALEEGRDSTTGPVAEDLHRLTGDLAGGVSLSDALERWQDHRPLPGVRLSVAALLLGVETGGAHARALDGVAATLRSELGVAAEVKALSSQARYSAMVIAAAPLVFAALASASDGATARFLFGTPTGWVCLIIGLSLDAIAALWMQRLARVEL